MEIELIETGQRFAVGKDIEQKQALELLTSKRAKPVRREFRKAVKPKRDDSETAAL